MPGLNEIGTRGAEQEERLLRLLEKWNAIKGRFGQFASNPAGFLAEGIRESFPPLTGDIRKDVQSPDVLGWGAMGPGAIGATVFHGSPHKFSKFDLGKVGTGEGAQAYGHGLYFAENPRVAESYAKTAGAPAWRGPVPLSYVADANKYAQMAGKTGDEARAYALQFLNDRAKNASPSQRQFINDAINNFDALERKGTSGHTYKVDLPDSAISKMLDWDKPLSQQPEAVRDAVKALLPENIGGNVVGADRTTRYAHSKGDMTGAEAHALLMNHYMGNKGTYAGVDKVVAEELRNLGITGIKYLDQGSRASGRGTSNYVVFDENLPKIIGTE